MRACPGEPSFGINMTFDYEDDRFGNDMDIIIDRIAQFAKALENKEYQIILLYHMQNDTIYEKRKVSLG